MKEKTSGGTQLCEFDILNRKTTPLESNRVRVLVRGERDCWIEITPTPTGIEIRSNDDTADYRALTIRPESGNAISVTMEKVR